MKPFVDQPPAKLDYCPSCASYYWRDHGHECLDAEPESDWVVLAILASVAIALVLLASGKWNPGWPAS